MTEELKPKAERKTIPLELGRAAEGIVKRLSKEVVTLALLFRQKKDFAMHFLLNGELHEDGPSALQIVTSLYHGDEYEYGAADKRKKMFLPSHKELIEELASQVPEEEKRIPVAKKPVSIKEVKHEAMLTTAKTMLKFNIPIDAIISATGLTAEEVNSLTEVKEDF